MFIKTDQQSGLGISIYPNEEASEAGDQQRNQDSQSTEMAPLMRRYLELRVTFW